MKILYHGTFFKYHSLATINRELALRLMQWHELALEPYEQDEFDSGLDPRYRPLEDCYWRTLEPFDIVIRHRYPPDLSPPWRVGSDVPRLVLLQPWEYWAFPFEWVSAINRRASLLIAPSSFCRDGYLDSGVRSELVRIVPYGLDLAVYRPDGPAWELPDWAQDRFVFGFAGGCIHRKGWDVLVRAYRKTFSKRDQVLLVIKDSPFYSRQSVEPQFPEGDAPILYLLKNLAPAELASLYRSFDCGVFPHRGEGFSLMAAELMATGRPCIITNWSGNTDFCTQENSFLLDYQVVRGEGCQIDGMPTRVPVRLAEPDFDQLCDLMRSIYELGKGSDKLMAMGHKAHETVQSYTWDRMAESVHQLLQELPESDRALLAADRQIASGRPDRAWLLLNRRPEEDRWGFAYEFFRYWLNQRIAQCLEWALACYGDWAPLQHHWGLLNLHRNRLSDARKAFQRAVELEPASTVSWYHLGLSQWRAGLLGPARQALLECLERDPSHEEAWKLLVSFSDPSRDGTVQKLQTKREEWLKARARQTITLACIVRDELEALRAAVQSLESVQAEELIVVHTGPVASGPMRELVESWPGGRGRYLHRPDWWDPGRGSIDDFAAARNVYLQEARGSFVLWFDADELWSPQHGPLVRQLVALPDGPDGASIPVICPQADEHGRMHETLTRHVKLVRNRRVDRQTGEQYRSPQHYADQHGCSLEEAVSRTKPLYEFRERIHEQIVVSMMEQGARIVNLEVPIRHTGYLADAATMEGKYHRNLVHCREMVAKDPESDWWRFNEMTTLLLMGRLAEARASGEHGLPYLHYDQAHAGKYLSTLASICMNLGDWQAGLKYSQMGIDHRLNEGEAWFNAGVCYQNLGQPEEAARCWKEAVRCGEEGSMVFTADLGAMNFKPLVNLSYLYEQMGDLERARQYAIQAACWNLQDQALRGRLRAYYQAMGRRGMVREQERWLVNQDLVRFISWRAQLACEDGCYRTAEAMFRYVCEQAPSADSLNGLAIALQAQRSTGDGPWVEDPEQYLVRALALDPSHAASYHNLIQYYSTQDQRLAEWLATVQRYHQAHPFRPEPYFWLGRLLEKLQLYRLAYRSYLACTVIDPGLARAWLGLARCSLQLDQPQEAGQAARRSVMLAPGDPEIQQGYREIERQVAQGRWVTLSKLV